jgi:hypothetical protein
MSLMFTHDRNTNYKGLSSLFLLRPLSTFLCFVVSQSFFRLAIASAFILIFFESIFIMCVLRHKKEVYLLETKLPVIAYAKNKWLIMFLRTFGRRRPPTGTEFKNSQIEGFLEEEGIKHEFSSPYTPQQNGVVERKNRNLLDMARTILDEYKTLDRFWAEAINTACYSINRFYLHRILKKTSYELHTSKEPNVSYFRVFGSKCFILIKRGRNSKFASKAVEGFLLGYESITRAYKVFNKSIGLVEVSCDIVFDETNDS